MSAPAAPAVITALDTSQVKSVGILTIVAIVLIGLLIARLVTKVVIRVIVLVVVVVAGLAVYQQRDKVTSAANDAAKKCDMSFFGIHVQSSDPNVKKVCDALDKQGSK